MEAKHDKGAPKSQPEKEQKPAKGSIHAPQKVAYPSEHDPKVNKWLRITRERAQKKA